MSQLTETTQPAVPSPNLIAIRRKRQARGFFAAAFTRFLSDKVSMVALVVFVLIALTAIFASPISTSILGFDRDANDLFNQLVPPGTEKHLLGTDELGRDNLARLLYGGQVSLSVGFLVAMISGI